MSSESLTAVIVIDKPLGITSHDVVDRLRKITGVRRVGHAGTLDPLASGVLIALIGRQATRRQAEFMGMPKEYEAEVTFGSVSDTYDAEGPLHEKASPEQLEALTEDTITETLKQFFGEIQQRPPAHSAIKVGGKTLYKEARKGTLNSEDIPFRTVTIDDIQLVEFTPGTQPVARILIRCQKGVYIRSLAHDLGEALAVGAYLSGLVRTRVGDYTVKNACELDSLTPEIISENDIS